MTDAVHAMDRAYENTAFIPQGDSYPARWAAAAEDFRAGAAGWVDAPYGAGERERVDLFLPEGSPRGLVVFVHGGYWIATDKSLWSHLAAGAVAAGWAVALPSYDLCPAIRIAGIVRQVARAVDHAAGLVAGPVILTGHSAGGHIVARLACGDVPLACRERLERVVPISPLSDLRSLRETSMNADLRIDVEEAQAESPVFHAPPAVPVHVVVGGAERPVFLDQARWLGDAWGVPVTVVPGRHHFDVIEGLEDAGSELCRILSDGDVNSGQDGAGAAR
ncbi:MAG: alpha/beta hydrolase [Rhodobacterales bacterium]|nr:alpha/beta hydrolase [Rhodobacterales bacterium]